MSNIAHLRRFWSWYRGAETVYQVHSPFVYRLGQAVLEDRRQFYAFDDIEALRWRLMRSKDTFEMTDYGAGSRVTGTTTRRLAQVAKDSANAGRRGRLLFRLVNFLKPQSILELGTSLGIGSLYQQAGAAKAEFITLEGCPQTAARARHHFGVMKRPGIEVRTGPFKDTLPRVLTEKGSFDYIFIDGDHRYEPTLRYFEQLLPHTTERSVLVFDDIHWSEGMERAWREIRHHERVALSIDFFFCGVVFFRSEQREQEHFDLAPTRWKPWMMR